MYEKNNLIIYLIFVLVVGGGIYLLFLSDNKKEKTSKVELVTGKEYTQFIPGAVKKEKSEKVIKKKIKLKKNDSTVIQESVTPDWTSPLSVAVHELNADSIEVNFDFSYFNELIIRVDTIKIIRIDTLKITNVIEKGIPFYRSFWFGSGGACYGGRWWFVIEMCNIHSVFESVARHSKKLKSAEISR
ncbi:MAG: hypothetical protein ACYCVH_05130 [Ignavibacteriaceae bacterium]